MAGYAPTPLLDLQETLAVKGFDGTSVGEDLMRMGYAGDTPVNEFGAHSFFAWHVEQGQVLEQKDTSASIIGKYRKMHLPGHPEHELWRLYQHLEKRYFETVDLGFPVFEGFGGNMGM